MYRIYFRQAIQMLKQNRMTGIIAIIGTALAIMMIMTIIVTEEIRNASVAPESNRNRTYYLDGHQEKDTVGSTNSSIGGMKYELIRDYILDLKEPELISVFSPYLWNSNITVNISGKRELFISSIRSTDANYWKIMDFKLLEGRLYTQEEFESGICYAVISDNHARAIFKDENVLSKTMEISGKEYRIIGVVQEAPLLFTHTTGDIWIPYTSVNKYDESRSFMVALMAGSTGDFPAIYAEIRRMEKKYHTERDMGTLQLRGPYNHRILKSNVNGFSEQEIKESINITNRKRIFILAILLLVPALNLSGISLSRIKKRTSEIGVRKAFGAKKYVILFQVLYENFITSIIGGVLGLIFSYIIVFQMKQWLLKLPPNADIPLNTLVSPAIFIAVFLACLVINLLSAGLPALRASRVTIINSITQNDR